LQPKAKETFVEKEDERRHNKPAPDAVLRAMEDETGPLPDAVAAAWNDDEEKPEFTKREDDRKRSSDALV
jgi:hypothetical protein